MSESPSLFISHSYIDWLKVLTCICLILCQSSHTCVGAGYAHGIHTEFSVTKRNCSHVHGDYLPNHCYTQESTVGFNLLIYIYLHGIHFMHVMTKHNDIQIYLRRRMNHSHEPRDYPEFQNENPHCGMRICQRNHHKHCLHHSPFLV